MGRETFGGLVCSAKFSRNLTLVFKKIRRKILHFSPNMLCPTDCLNHVLTVENTIAQGWLTHDKLDENVDAYIANHKPRIAIPETVLLSSLQFQVAQH